jgi:hypothetical protein
VQYTSGADILKLGALLVMARTRSGNPNSVGGVTGQDRVNKMAEEKVREWVAANRYIVPGYDLKKMIQC